LKQTLSAKLSAKVVKKLYMAKTLQNNHRGASTGDDTSRQCRLRGLRAAPTQRQGRRLRIKSGKIQKK
ncbi:MAG: hypothetical protein K2L66_04045, partial [Paramuribaculum sp.]|nr:hypothetical protein [Paramuribaculum sp.]